MDEGPEAHLSRVLERVTRDLRAKYEDGQLDHGGNLWEQAGMLDHALAEALDLVVYLYTALEQRERLGSVR